MDRIARIFIDRPVLGVVIAAVIVLAGAVAYKILPVAQYPEIAPPTVQVTAQYPGANARVVADTVAAPIEQQVNGVERMLYMTSQSGNDGSYNLTVTFELGTDLNMAQVLVQNRVSQAVPTLPDQVKAIGVTTLKKSPSILLVVNLYSDVNPKTGKPYFDQLYLSNYATIQLKDELARLEGVGDVLTVGQQDYSMRIWLNPEKMASLNLTAADVVNALKEQNVQVAAGSLGQPPVPKGIDFQYTLSTLGRLVEEEQFGEIIIKTGGQGQVVRLKDVGRIELGARSMTTLCYLDGKQSAGLAIFQLPGSNALQTADHVREKMKELEERFPKGLKYAIVYDTTPFVEESISAVIHTLFEAVILVAIVVLFFLQDWKAMILPLIDVPVSLVGTLFVMYLMGFSLNNLTLFGLVLAIGIVVDDAIVVLENVETWIARGYDPRTATIKAMREVTGPIIAITLVLSSVFIPSALLPGITGRFYQQFALTIATTMIISAVNAMTMTPSRAVMIFKTEVKDEHGHIKREALPWWIFGVLAAWAAVGWLLPRLFPEAARSYDPEAWGLWLGFLLAGALAGGVFGWFLIRPINDALGWVFRGFNRFFDRVTAAYGRTVAWSMRLAVIVAVVYAGLIALTGFTFTSVPVGFIPSQDKGYLIVNVQLPDSASLERTTEVMLKAEKIARATPGVAHTVAIPGNSFVYNAVSSNYASMFIVLKPFEERRGPGMSSEAIAAEVRKKYFMAIEEAQVMIFGPPAVDGLGNAGGFKLMVQDRGSLGLGAMQAAADNLAEKASAQPGFAGVMNSFRANTPQYYVDVDRTKCKTLGVKLDDVFATLQVYLGGYYVNDFNKFGRTWQVNVQAEPQFRMQARDVKQLKVRNDRGDMVPLGTLGKMEDYNGPVTITRYNMYPAAALNGATLPGVSTGTVVATVDELSRRELPAGMATQWTELMFLQLQEGMGVVVAFAGAIILVYLVLAGLYESYTQPLSVILVMPLCLLAALVGVILARLDINVFVQVGFVVLVGLASKNAILIVEFARERVLHGMSPFEAALDASKARLRPIVMTSFAFIGGVVPLVLATGAGAEMRFALGVAVFAGMIGVTVFGIFLTPVFFYGLERLTGEGAAARVRHRQLKAADKALAEDDVNAEAKLAAEEAAEAPSRAIPTSDGHAAPSTAITASTPPPKSA